MSAKILYCLQCGGDTKVLETRELKSGAIKRRRCCLRCNSRHTTYESLLTAKEMAETAERIRASLNYLDALKAELELVRLAISTTTIEAPNE